MKKKIAFIVPYPIGIAPSQRFRFEQYLSILEQNNYETTCFPFLTIKDFNLLYSPGKYLNKSWSIVKGFFKRLLLILSLKKYAVVFIHREVSPVGPPIFEWIISKLLKKKIIYDFDDAIWLKNTSESNKIISKIKKHSKVTSICQWSSLVMCGNHFLMSFAKKYNARVVHVPTTIDTTNLHNKKKAHHSGPVIIGWTGTHSTIKYLYGLEDLIIDLQKKHNVIFRIISDQNPYFKTVKYEYLPWNKENEINDLLDFDIGLMPLSDDEWSKGKCGFKALQYMALEIPTVTSPVGVNTEIIEDGVNGYLATTEKDWIEKITALIDSKELRNKIGLEGRGTVLNKYSVKSTQNNYIAHFNQLIK